MRVVNIVAVSLFVIALGCANDNPAGPPPEAWMSLELERDVITSGEKFELKVKLKNVNGQPLRYYFSSSCQFYWEYVDRDGRAFAEDFVCLTVLTDLELEPLSTYEVVLTLSTLSPPSASLWPFEDGKLPPGEYSVRVSLLENEDKVPPQKVPIRVTETR